MGHRLRRARKSWRAGGARRGRVASCAPVASASRTPRAAAPPRRPREVRGGRAALSAYSTWRRNHPRRVQEFIFIDFGRILNQFGVDFNDFPYIFGAILERFWSLRGGIWEPFSKHFSLFEAIRCDRPRERRSKRHPSKTLSGGAERAREA